MSIPVSGDFDHEDVGPVRYSYEREELTRRTSRWSDDEEPTGMWLLTIEYEYMPPSSEFADPDDRPRPVSREFSHEFDEKPKVSLKLVKDLFKPWIL